METRTPEFISSPEKLGSDTHVHFTFARHSQKASARVFEQNLGRVYEDKQYTAKEN
ncbi:MAG TPA: hypothetical protein VJA27_02635 [Patescibacteria group bacterium]|nr:hypothetical protein [Patescibacteria group bacterium]